jgi:acetylornithine deacetylase/succinyl-diaminopimelate desuccinylase-like protein
MTLSPNVVHGGQKTNTIPDAVDIDVDIRTLPGQTFESAVAFVNAALGDLASRVEISTVQRGESSRSPMENVLWDVLTKQTQVAYPGADLLPGMMVGGTDARFYREKGSVAFGAALFSPDVTFESFGQRFHGNDERIDLASLGLSTEFWYGIAKELVG